MEHLNYIVYRKDNNVEENIREFDYLDKAEDFARHMSWGSGKDEPSSTVYGVMDSKTSRTMSEFCKTGPMVIDVANYENIGRGVRFMLERLPLSKWAMRQALREALHQLGDN